MPVAEDAKEVTLTMKVVHRLMCHYCVEKLAAGFEAGYTT